DRLPGIRIARQPDRGDREPEQETSEHAEQRTVRDAIREHRAPTFRVEQICAHCLELEDPRDHGLHELHVLTVMNGDLRAGGACRIWAICAGAIESGQSRSARSADVPLHDWCCVLSPAD